MKFLEIKSSTIKGVAYDPGTMSLYVKFNSGHYYKYHNVSNSRYLEFLNSKSKGKFFAEHIRNKPAYPHTKLSQIEIENMKITGALQ